MGAILIVCTGNICRSPMAEGFLRHELALRLVEGAPEVTSAGTWGFDAEPAVAEAVDAAAERGVDISGHRSRALQEDQIERADLVIGMTQEHRDKAIALASRAASRAFTLKEVARLVERLPAVDPTAGAAGLSARVAAADGLRRSGFRGVPADEDIVDPLGMPPETFRAVAWEVQELCVRVAHGLFGTASRSDDRGTAGAGAEVVG